MTEVTLTVETPRGATEVRLNRGRLTVGRGADAMLVIDDGNLSRLHATIHHGEAGVWIADENSTNGTTVNGRPVPPGDLPLADGDQVSLGNSTNILIRFRAHAASPARAHDAGGQFVAPHAAHQVDLSAAKSSAPIVAAVSIAAILLLAGLAAAVSYVYQRREEQAVAAARKRTRARKPPAAVPTPAPEGEDVTEGPPPENLSVESPDASLREASLKVEEERGEPVGHEASVEVPPELKHYPNDRYRFLAVQTAEAREHDLRTPHDFAELAAMVAAGRLTELKPLGENHVLYGVGGGATDEPFTHFDAASNESLPLYRDAAELQTALAELTERAAGLEAAEAKKVDERRKKIAFFYKAPGAYRLADSELNTLARFAGGSAAALDDGLVRREIKQRLLSHLRPAAVAVLEELARSYRAQFNRPLPVASLVRTEQYQRELSRTNLNAARVSMPPHTTGLAFDISYRYMTAAEQGLLMAEIARLKQAGRVEALRENNNCFHVFVFTDGRPPPESLVRKSYDRPRR